MSRRLRRCVAKLGLLKGLELYLLRKRGSGLIEATPQGYAHPVFVRRGASDFRVFEDIFLCDQYDHPVDFEPRVIIDAGANVGYASVFFARQFPQARIFAIEPDDSNLELLRRNVAPYPNVEVIRGGLWGRETRLSVSNPEADKWAIQVIETPDRPDALEAHSVDSLMARYGLERIDILKIDIEGSELNVFSAPSAVTWLPKVRRLVAELHDREGFPPGIDHAFNTAIAPYPHTRRQSGEDTIIDFQGAIQC